jgi:hypothetical protein
MTSTPITLAQLLQDWLVEKGHDKLWNLSPGYPNWVLSYQKLLPSPSWAKPMAYYMAVLDDRVVSDLVGNTNLVGDLTWETQLGIMAADPEFFDKLEKKMIEVESQGE